MEEKNPEDIVTFDVPLFIRLLEFAREDATDDETLHKVTDNIIKMCEDGQVLTMDQYDAIIDTQPEVDTSNMTSVEDGLMNETEYRWYKIAGIKQNKNMNAINEQRWLKLAGIINENEVKEATEASAWLVYEKDNHPLVLRFASADRAKAKKIEMEERDDNAVFGSLVFTSLESLGSYLEKEYNITNVEKYRYLK